MSNAPTSRAFTPAGFAAAAGGNLSWGVGIIIIKLTVSSFVVVSFYRHVFAIPVLGLLFLFSSDRSLPWRAGAVGGALFALHQIAHFGGLRFSTAAVVTILFSLQPLVVGMAGSRVTGERASPRFYLWSIVAVGGCAVLVLATSSADTSALGTFLAVLNLFAWSAYFLATKREREHSSTTAWLLVMTLVSGSILGIIALIFGQSLGEPTGIEWIHILALALVPATLGHFLVTWAHPRIHAAASSALTLSVPVIASIGAAVFLDEPFGVQHAIGGAIALTGAGVAMRYLPAPLPLTDPAEAT